MAAVCYEIDAQLILQSRENANLLVGLLEKINSDCKDEVLEVIRSLGVVFNSFLAQRLWHESQVGLDDSESFDQLLDTNVLGAQNIKENMERSGSKRVAEIIYASWMHRQYLAFVKDLLCLCNHKDGAIQRSALDCLMSFLVSDYNAAVLNANCNPKQWYFPTSLFSRIIDGIFSSELEVLKTQLDYFQHKYLGFIDIQFYTVKNIHRIVNGKSKSVPMSNNLKAIICTFLMKTAEKFDKGQNLKGYVISGKGILKKVGSDSKEIKKLISNTWLSLLQLKHSDQCLKLILVNLNEKIIPQIEDPKLLIDFLTDCYNLEGSTALLALSGLFHLIQKYNLDYPDFFKKLYNLLDADTFRLQYKDRFLALTDLFLTSMNLPGYMAASFIKRLARISLTASPDGIRVILVIIENLMKRHPGCKVLIHRKVNTQFATKEQALLDTYQLEEPDPAMCNAQNSSLWELKALEQHYSSDIPEAVKVFYQPFGRQENDLNHYLDLSYADVLDKELASFEDDGSALLNSNRPTDLFNTTLYENNCWSFC